MTAAPWRYRHVPGWEQLPSPIVHKDVPGVAVDSQDRVFVLTRRGPSRVLVFDRNGRYLNRWGEGVLSDRTHGITIAPDGSVYVVDRGAVFHFDSEGRSLDVIGVPDTASDTGYDGSDVCSITRSGPPFNKPTNVAVGLDGDLYVSDGYGNARVHRFTPSGRLVRSWGEPGTGRGQFHLVHGIAVADDGRVLVADRENDRIQFFTPEGQWLEEWTDVQRPTNIALDRSGNIYVSEMWRRPGQVSLRLGPANADLPGRLSVFNPDGVVLARWGGTDRQADGQFIAPHDVCVDSVGDVYVGEVSFTEGVLGAGLELPLHTLQKFTRELV